jgi:predicted glycoside hydrolase/deacetylase ChbG (UPF0249 family)
MKYILLSAFVFLLNTIQAANAQTSDSTYAEKLGFPKNAKVLILHVDDVGMSFDSNEGAINAITKGVATSCSMMMPCPWVPGFIHFIKDHPDLDVGLHLTLTSEWKEYRWGPLSGKFATPGLVDAEGAMWPSVEGTIAHATADEVDKEIHAQLQRAKEMGFTPTHFDTHMGTLLANKAFAERYIKLGIENHIPVMLPAGHATLIRQQTHTSETVLQQYRMIGQVLWNAGLPVLDDLHNTTYGWSVPDSLKEDDQKIQAYKTRKYIEAIRTLQPGLTMMIMHCTNTSETFKYISDSGPLRKSDMLAMMDPAFKQALKDNGIILTTWREVKERRDNVRN